jgi:DNA-binding transcriptional MerR regulator
MKTLYPPRQVADACGLTPVSLRSYHGCGLRCDGPVTAHPEGDRRNYSDLDAVSAAVMHRLVQRGISRRHAADIVNDSRKHFDGRFWLAVFPGPDADSAPGRQGGNAATSVAKVLTTSRPDGSMPAEVIVMAVHQIAADVRRRLDGATA